MRTIFKSTPNHRIRISVLGIEQAVHLNNDCHFGAHLPSRRTRVDRAPTYAVVGYSGTGCS